MSRFDYQASRELEAQDPPFYALIMAAMRRADTDNKRLLDAAFPDTAAELQARYDAPGGLLPGERARVEHRIYAHGEHRVFAADAFADSLGTHVLIKLEGAPVGTAILTNAVVADDGKSALLTLDIDAELATREIEAVRLP